MVPRHHLRRHGPGGPQVESWGGRRLVGDGLWGTLEDHGALVAGGALPHFTFRRLSGFFPMNAVEPLPLAAAAHAPWNGRQHWQNVPSDVYFMVCG